MSFLQPFHNNSVFEVLSWCSGEVPARGKVDLELLTYVTEADFIVHGTGAPEHPLLPVVFRPSRIISEKFKFAVYGIVPKITN